MRGRDFFGSQNFSNRLDELDTRLIRRDEVMRLLYDGRKINAIKVYREDTGASLADAKAAVERMEFSFGSGTGSLSQDVQDEPLRNEADRDALTSEVTRLLIQGQKINAIKLYREQTGLGLREAKEAVDLVEKGLPVGSPELFRSQMSSLDVEKSTPLAGEPDEAVRRLVLAGDKIRAIKLYREQTGLGLREAKEAIDHLAQTLR